MAEHEEVKIPVKSRAQADEEQYLTPQAVEGIWRDEITYQDGRIEVREWKHNLVVNKLSELLAALFKTHSGIVGAQYWAVGRGDPAWDSRPDTNGDGLPDPPQPTVTQAQLLDEIARKTVAVVFLDASNNETSSITNRVEVSATFNVGEANGPWREWGVFGGNATSTKDSGYMADAVNHPVLSKPAGDGDFSITRRVRFTF